jgi:hypothetical protein
MMSLSFVGLDGKKASVTIADGVGFFTIKNIAKDTVFAIKPSNTKTFAIQTVSVEGYDCDVSFDKNKSFEVKVSQLKATLTSTSPKCYGTKDGAVSLTSNGNAFVWNDPSIGNNKDIKNLTQGNFAVTVSDDLACTLVLNTSITEPKPIDMTVTATKTCVGLSEGSVELKASGGAGNIKYYFQGKPYDDGKMTGLLSGTYSAMVKDKNGCTSKTETIKVENFPVTTLQLDAGDTTSIVKGYEALKIHAIIHVDGRKVTDVPSENFQYYEWLPYPCQNCLDIPARTDSSTTYKLKIVDKYGCKVFDKIRIGVDELVKEVDYPNAVTEGNPFKILNPHKSVRKFNVLRIFDRWGNLLFQQLNFKPDEQIGWDGTFRGVNVEPGVYVWIAVAEFLDGSTKIFKGDITVVGGRYR